MTETKLLPQDPRQAVETMLKVTEELVARIDIETNALATNDGTAFTMNEDNKEIVIDVYEKTAKEFHDRLPEFTRVDKDLIAKLDNAQQALKKSTTSNLKLIEKLEPEEE